MPTLHGWFTFFCLPVIAGAMVSCAAMQHAAVDPVGAAPEDFSIDMTILTGRRDDAGAEAHVRQSRLVLFADGSLHYGVDPSRRRADGTGGRGAEWLPARIRTLDRAQVASLWSLAQQLGFSDPARSDENFNFTTVQAREGGVVWMVTFTGGSERWSFVRSARLGEQPDPAMSQLARELAELAWAGMPLEPRGIVLPHRRDYGPDPYERYRR